VQLDERPKFTLGERLRVLAGVFADKLGLFDGMADRDSISILSAWAKGACVDRGWADRRILRLQRRLRKVCLRL
jgi:hypothetical protein